MSSATDGEADFRPRIQQHWEASERGDIDTEHASCRALLTEARTAHPRGADCNLHVAEVGAIRLVEFGISGGA